MPLRLGKPIEHNRPQARKQVCDACDGCGLLKGGGIGSQAKVCKKCQGSGKVAYLTPTDRCHGPRLVR